jgi:hypothetical protein
LSPFRKQKARWQKVNNAWLISYGIFAKKPAHGNK